MNEYEATQPAPRSGSRFWHGSPYYDPDKTPRQPFSEFQRLRDEGKLVYCKARHNWVINRERVK